MVTAARDGLYLLPVLLRNQSVINGYTIWPTAACQRMNDHPWRRLCNSIYYFHRLTDVRAGDTTKHSSIFGDADVDDDD